MRRHATPRAAGWTQRRSRLALPGRPGAVPRRLIALVLLLPLLIGVAGPPTVRGDELSDAIARQKALATRVREQRAQVARIRSLQGGLAQEIASTRTELAGINANLVQTRKRITKVTARVAQVQAVYDDLVAQVSQLNRQVVAIEAEQAEKANELRERRAMLAARLREAYRTDRMPLVQTVLSAGSFTDLLQDVDSYLDLGAQDRALADRIEGDARTLDSLRALLLDTRLAREDLSRETLVQKQELDARLKELRAAKARLAELQKETARQLAVQRASYARMARNRSALAAAIARNAAAQRKLSSKIAGLVARQRSLGNIPSQYNGTLQWPMSGTVSQEYGCTGYGWEPRVGGCAHFHQGIDIVAPAGTPVRAAGDGRIVYAGWNYADGADPAWIVIIAHSGSLQTWYAHLRPVRPAGASAGDAVHRGQVIGYEGNTGHSTGAHLHWMVMFNGTFANPRLFT